MFEITDQHDVQHCGRTERHPPHESDVTSEIACPGEGVITVSWSEISSARQCFFQHELGYVQRWTKQGDYSGALGKGTLFHMVLEAHYLTIKRHQQAIGVYDVDETTLTSLCKHAVMDVLNRAAEDGCPDEIIDLMIFMYKGYLSLYGIDPQWKIIAVEHTAIVPLFNPDGSESWIRLKVKIDLIVEDDKGRWIIIDHKSCSNLPTSKDLDFNDQFGLYVFALRKLGLKNTILYAMHNAARTAMNKGDILKEGDEGWKKSMKPQRLEDRFLRTPLSKTPGELQVINDEALAWMKLTYSDANPKTRVPDEELCKWKCSYTEACLFGRRTNEPKNVVVMLEALGFRQDHTRH